LIAFERRASTVLFNLIRARRDTRPYLIPANACPILAVTLLKARVPFELVDISSTALEIDATRVFDLLRSAPRRYGGMIYVRSYGALSDATQFFREFQRFDPTAAIFDDRCLCAPEFGEDIDETVDAKLYSTGHAKCVDVGWGGYAIVRAASNYASWREPFHADDLERLTAECKHALAGGEAFEYAPSRWLDSRKPPLAWPRYREHVRAQRMNALRHKRTLNAIYEATVPDELQLPSPFQQWRFNIHVANPEVVLAKIFESGLFASRHYVPLTRAFGTGSAPVAEAVYGRIVNLFNDRYFTADQAIRTAEIVRRVGLAAPSSNSSLVVQHG
jgi:hypothetical protein